MKMIPAHIASETAKTITSGRNGRALRTDFAGDLSIAGEAKLRSHGAATVSQVNDERMALALLTEYSVRLASRRECLTLH
jgi:hypothetical protein